MSALFVALVLVALTFYSVPLALNQNKAVAQYAGCHLESKGFNSARCVAFTPTPEVAK